MTDTTTHPQQQSGPAAEPAQYHEQDRLRWPVNPGYQADAPRWPPAVPPAPPAVPPAPPTVPPAPPAAPPMPPDAQPGTTGAGPHRNRRWLAAGALVATLAIGGGAVGGAIGTQLDDQTGAGASGTGSAPAARTVSSDNLADVVAAVSPSIVDVQVATGRGTAEGSGIVLTPDGRVVTNNHVVEGAAGRGEILVTLADGRRAPATVVGTDARADIAVLQMQGVSGLTPATLGDSSSLKVGDTVLAFGSPLGLQGTVTSGIVSALDRSMNAPGESLSGLVQTDAAINHGNSGGALVDTAGRVVGVNVGIITDGQDSGNIGVGFAIPVDTVKRVVDQIAD